MGATIKDVAKLANVSIKTVSNVLNDYPYLTKETREKVERAIAELDYRPNISARNLRRGRTGIIALALPTMSSPYFAEIADLVVKAASERNLTVLIDLTDGELDREKHVAEGFRSRLIDGMILQPWSVSAGFLRSRSTKSPLVLLGERPLGGVDSVAIDSREAAGAAVRHLLEQGRRRIGVIGARAGRHGTRRPREPGRRHEGYAKALEAYDIPYDPALVVTPEGEHNPEKIDRAVGRLLDSAGAIDGVFCFNDRIALAVVRALLTRGIAVPEKVAVIGIDDVEAARLNTPSVSTIKPDKEFIVRTALDMLVERIGGSERPARRISADFELVVRESTVGSRN